MGLSCGAKFLKYCLFAFNLIFVIGGLVCLGVGIWLIADRNASSKLETALHDVKINSDSANNYVTMPNAVRNLGIVLAVGGAIILVIAFLGCCGAVKEWRPLLILYAIFLIIILALEIAAAVYTAVNKDSIDTNVKNYLAETLKLYGNINNNDSNPNPIRTAWDTWMSNDLCCGVDPTYADDRGFHKSQWFNDIRAANCPPNYDDSISDSHPYPAVCCNRDPVTKLAINVQKCVQNGYQYCVKTQILDTGCYSKVSATLHNQMAVIIGVGITVGVIQLVGILFAFCLCCAIGQENPQ